MSNLIAIIELIDKIALPLFLMTLVVVVAVRISRWFFEPSSGQMAKDIIDQLKPNRLTNLKKSKDDAHGVIFGLTKSNQKLYSPEDAESHTGVFSATGTGKTSAVLIGSLRSLKDSNAFVIDISGDIDKNCDIENKLIYEPDNPDTPKYNIFAPIDALPPEERPEALSMLAYLIMPSSDAVSSNANAKFFHDNGRRILQASLIAFYDSMDFTEIAEKVVYSNHYELFRAIDATNNQLAKAFINGFENSSEQNTSGCKQVCNEALELYCTNQKIRNSIGRPEAGKPAIEPTALETNRIFVIVSEDKLSLYAPLLNIITSQMMQYISTRRVDKDSKTIFLFLDEFPALGISSSIILDAVRRFRKRKARVVLLMQNIVDLDLLYGKECSRAILSNLHYKVLLGGLNDPESQLYFSQLIGKRSFMNQSVSYSNNSKTITKSEVQQYAIEPAMLDRQGASTVLLICSDVESGYIKLKKNYYFKQ